MIRRCYVGFDTSNYTTSAAAVAVGEDGELSVIANCKAPLPVGEGERGLRQSDAVFAHTKNLPVVIRQLAEHIEGYSVCGVGYSSRPRDVEDSYMPVFLSGKVAAEAYASALGVPLYEFSHQNGHIMAALYSSGALADGLLRKSFFAFHLSGGTTEAVLVAPHEVAADGARDGFFTSRLLCATADINAGQAIDRAGVAMGLAFPCGREMEQLAREWMGDIPSMKITVNDGKCNLSGLENKALQLYASSQNKSQVSAFVFSVIGKTVLKMTEYLQAEYSEEHPYDVLYAGGVMSNTLMRPMLSEGKNYKTYFAEPQYSADNAAGVALMTAMRAEGLK
ncbi:MAG: peptidase M22 [Clostridia bacterium]|nr:peptidase M22 [Clostridia bacterium]